MRPDPAPPPENVLAEVIAELVSSPATEERGSPRGASPSGKLRLDRSSTRGWHPSARRRVERKLFEAEFRRALAEIVARGF